MFFLFKDAMPENTENQSPTEQEIYTNNEPNKPLIKKFFFCWLALLVGFIGAHWIYQGNFKRALPHLIPIFGSLLGFFDCIRYGLMPDESFNTLFNVNYSKQTKQTNGLVVCAVGLALAAGVVVLMSTIAIVFQLMLTGTVA